MLLFLVDYEKESHQVRWDTAEVHYTGEPFMLLGSKLFNHNEIRITVHLRDVDVVEFRNLCWALLS